MTLRPLIGIYSIALGLAVLGLWSMILAGDDLPEGPLEIRFHLLSEALMALGAVVSGAMLLRSTSRAAIANAAAHATVIYSTLNAAGYYAERQAPCTATAMAALAAVSAVIVAVHLKAVRR